MNNIFKTCVIQSNEVTANHEFAIDEEYEGCEYYYKIEGNKIYYTQNINGIDVPPMTDSLIVTHINDTAMAVVWFNPTMKVNERFVLKKIK